MSSMSGSLLPISEMYEKFFAPVIHGIYFYWYTLSFHPLGIIDDVYQSHSPTKNYKRQKKIIKTKKHKIENVFKKYKTERQKKI